MTRCSTAVRPRSGLLFVCILLGGGAMAVDQIQQDLSHRDSDQPGAGTFARGSQYIAMRDGTKIAIDVYRPSKNGRVLADPLPTILVVTPYHRRAGARGGRILPPESYLETMRDVFIEHGYAVVYADLRGHGASFGTAYAGGTEASTTPWDVWDTVEWVAAQPWSTGKIGMFGCSYDGETAWRGASVMPPHLSAIAPCAAPSIDRFNNGRVNGINMIGGVEFFDKLMYALDVANPAAPVDEDKTGVLREAAIAEHRIAWDRGLAAWAPARAARPFRDSIPPYPEWGYATEGWNYLPNFMISKIPAMQFVGWRDMNAPLVLAWYRSLAKIGVNTKIVIGPWYHCAWYTSPLFDAKTEHVRWFDYWLKGVKNGITDEPNVTYYLTGAPAGTEWRSAKSWPLPNTERVTYFLSGSAGSAESLSAAKPKEGNGADEYLVNYMVSGSRFNVPPLEAASADAGLKPVIMNAVDEKSLIYTSAPLEMAVEITGIPRASLWVSSTATDQDFFVYVEELDEQGVSSLVTEGALRASNRATRTAPYDNEGFPWHASLKQDWQPLEPGVPVFLDFALNPISRYIEKGRRIRVTINNFDSAIGFDTPLLSPTPTTTIYRNAQHPSSVTLPFILGNRSAY
jgi:putative CocE/NonD family hydrolase